MKGHTLAVAQTPPDSRDEQAPDPGDPDRWVGACDCGWGCVAGAEADALDAHAIHMMQEAHPDWSFDKVIAVRDATREG